MKGANPGPILKLKLSMRPILERFVARTAKRHICTATSRECGGGGKMSPKVQCNGGRSSSKEDQPHPIVTANTKIPRMRSEIQTVECLGTKGRAKSGGNPTVVSLAPQLIHAVQFGPSTTSHKEEPAITSPETSQNMILAGDDDTTFLIEILKFLIVAPTRTNGNKSNNANMKNWSQLIVGRPNIECTKTIIKRDIDACRSVSKIWNKAVWEIMSPGIPGIISTPELAHLKQRICRLDLSSLNAIFVKNLKELWGNDTIDWGRKNFSSLEILLNYMHQSHEGFAKSVSKEYKKFLLVKAVEAVAVRGNRVTENFHSAWKEKCQPTKVVDLYWHSHMLSPRKYQQDCMDLVSEIIDHEPFYENPKHHKGSDYLSKLSLVTAMEEAVFIRKRIFPRRMLFETGDKDIHEMGKAVMRQLELETCCG